MVSAPVLFDTCILIDYLRGIPQARSECGRYSDRAISIITWMEVMSGATDDNQDETRAFLVNFQLMLLTLQVAERAVAIRKTTRMKLPDAVIQATAEENGRILITRNTRDFPVGKSGVRVRVPYTV